MLKFIKNLFADTFNNEACKTPKYVTKTCKTCRFKTDMYCTVGTYYAEKGMIRICYEGELWQAIDQN